MFKAQERYTREAILKRLLILISVPLIWVFFDESWNDDPDFFNPLENKVLDWQFQIRGELKSPVKIFYVDIDAKALEIIGDPPWDYSYLADATRILFNLGEIKAVGFDIGFSPRYKNSQLVSERKVWESDRTFSEVVRKYPNMVLAAGYNESYLDGHFSGRQKGRFPYLDEGFLDPSKNPFPDMPTYPIINDTWGTVGLVDRYPERDAGPVPRWVPLYSEYEGSEYTEHLVEGVRKYEGLPKSTRFVKGSNEVLLDEEGSVFYSLPRKTSHTFYSMGLQLALMYWGLDESAIHYRTTRLKIMDDSGKVYAQIPMANRQVVELNWFSKWKNDELNPRCSLVDLFEHARDYYEGTAEEQRQAELFFDQMHGAIVLVGQVDPSLNDLSPTPFDVLPVPNVGIQGNLIKTIVSGLFIKHPPVWGTILIIGLLTALLTGMVLYRGAYSVIYDTVVIVLFFSYLVFVFIAFDLWSLVLPIVAPVGAAVTTAVAALAMRIIDYEKQKHRMKTLFGTYVSPDLVNRMIERREEPRLGGFEENITAFFSDIEHFTALSEMLRPSELVALINEYLDAMTSILKENGGTLDKYIGDAIVAMFGAPFAIHDHPMHACRAAIELHARQAELREKWSKDVKFSWPDLVVNMRTRIGLNTGFATVGNMGSATRFNYTMMGDAVNLAARAEQIAKVYGAKTVLTQATVDPASAQDSSLVFRFLDDVLISGRSGSVRVYELIGYQDEVPAPFWNCMEVFEQARSEYLNRNWLAAYALFEKAALLEFSGPAPSDPHRINPSRVFMDRCRQMHEHSPAESWTGVYEVRIK